MRTHLSVVLLLGLLAAACEEGPEQIYKPNPKDLDIERFNGWHAASHVIEGTQPFVIEASGQKTGTTKICEADELAQRWTKMVKEPIRPMFGAGGLNWRGEPEWSGLTVDQAQQSLCQAYIGEDYAYWGDNAELIAFFDTKTRLIYGLLIWPGYEGEVTAEGYKIAVNQPLVKDGAPLADPYSEDNLRALNSALLRVFRPEVPAPDQRDCVALNTCYVRDWNTLKVIAFQDLSFYVVVEPKANKISQIEMYFDRSFALSQADVSFVSSPAPLAGLPPAPRLDYSATCHPELGMTWKHIVDNCLGLDPAEKALTTPEWSNEVILADMGGLSIFLERPNLPVDQYIPEDVRPELSDEIVGMGLSSNYEGRLAVSRTALYAAYLAAVEARAMEELPGLGLSGRFAQIVPDGEDPETLPLGIQAAQDCSKIPCAKSTLTILTRQVVTEEALAQKGSVPALFQDPNFYVEAFLRALLAVFNEQQNPGPSEMYIYATDDSAEVLVARLTRKLNGERYAVSLAYHNKSDQLVQVFFKRGSLRPEHILYRDAEMKLAGGYLEGDGIFRLWNLINSPRLGLGKGLAVKQEFSESQKALVTVPLDQPTDVLAFYHELDSLSGYWVPVDGQRDLFVPAAQLGFTGNVIGATFYTDDQGKVRSIASGAFYDRLDFCGHKVGLYDPIAPVLANLPDDCEVIIKYSENSKIISSISTYTQTAIGRIGLRLSVLADRVDSARYWIDE